MRKIIDPSAYDTDKKQLTHYLRNYEGAFEHLVGKEIRLLELGVYKGGSLKLWRDYFDHGVIVGLDAVPAEINDPSGRIRLYRGRQEDTQLLDQIAAEQAPDGFDIIIDDCSHIGELTRTSFWHLLDNHLKPGGIFCIEDWGTGYWSSWPDGMSYCPAARRSKSIGLTRPIRWALRRLSPRILNVKAMGAPYRKRFASHDYGMVWFVKELVDECGVGDATHAERGVPPSRPSKFQRMIVSHGHVIVVKAQ